MNPIKTYLSNIKALILDFDGVLTDNKVYVDKSGKESVKCNRSDGIGIKALQDFGIKCVVMSSEPNDIVTRRCNKLGIEVHQGLSSKVDKLKEWIDINKIDINETCFIGNDINDIDIMRQVFVSVAVKDSHPDVLKIANLVTNKAGGDGAVRELCDWIVDSHTYNEIQDLDDLWSIVLPEASDLGKRVWGTEEQLGFISKKVMMKKLIIKAGQKGGLQYHRKRAEIGFIVKGKIKIKIGFNGKMDEKILSSGDHFVFVPGLIHQEEAITDVEIIEASTPWLNDRVRVEEKFDIDDNTGLKTTAQGDELFK